MDEKKPIALKVEELEERIAPTLVVGILGQHSVDTSIFEPAKASPGEIGFAGHGHATMGMGVAPG